VSLRGLLVIAVGAALLAPAAHASEVQRPPVTWVRGEGSYTKASRKPQAIKYIVIHVTEGGFEGSVYVLTGSRSHASAHYVVSRDGKIAQLVHQSDIAWHAGNMAINRASVGIEHVGMTYDAAGFPRAEYVASAKLAAWIARRSLIPIDRAHFIGHNEVPDPFNPDARGGSDHHTDPGPYWNWKLYLRLVRQYAYPAPDLRIRSTILDEDRPATGILPWRVETSGPKVKHVDFLVDGRVVWSDSRAPFTFAAGRGWNTTQVANGPHVLEARAVAASGKVARSRVRVSVSNRVFDVTTAGIRDWTRVRGTVTIAAKAVGARTTGLSLYVNGRVVSRDRTAPYRLVWNTHRVANGRHTVTVAAEAVDGRVKRRRFALVVDNRPKAKAVPKKAVPKPRPKPKPKAPVAKPTPTPNPRPKPVPKPAAPAVVSQSLTEGQALEGAVTWQAQVTGTVARVEFVVDGAVRATLTTAPWSFSWDTAAEPAGRHVALVRAIAADGRSAELAATVEVVSPAPAPAPLVQPTDDPQPAAGPAG
jgi:N-acetyl-anhydromuramyl-L-alanine amidase AmpD